GFPPGRETGCLHGTAWYARMLGGQLAAGASDETAPLPEVLGRGIGEVRRMHAGTCDLRNPATPQATVILARQAGGMLEYLARCAAGLRLRGRDGRARATPASRLAAIAARGRAACDLTRATPGDDRPGAPAPSRSRRPATSPAGSGSPPPTR